MTYSIYRPEPGQSLAALARILGHGVICHRSDLPGLAAADIAASVLPHGGPLTGELWAPWEVLHV